eukprot:m.68200 g.68200  ORF g.68200 m.68200 type:complete len:375 (+) comp7724_c0_seq3:1-1125(+)
MKCSACSTARAVLKRPKTGAAMCRECFYAVFEDEVHQTIVEGKIFRRGDVVAVGASGGKDSTVLAYVLKLLNERHDYGVNLYLLSIDEGITGYRDDSLETVKRNQQQYDLPLKILSYQELYGWTMDEIVRAVGLKSNCTFCGVFRRQALDRGAQLIKADKIVTGHNADDIAETVLMNVLRGDVPRLKRCTGKAACAKPRCHSSSGETIFDHPPPQRPAKQNKNRDMACAAVTTGSEGALPRSKPFKYTYEKEIVMYAYFKKLDYFSTECIYSPNAYRGYARAFLKDLEAVRSSSIIDIIHSGEMFCIQKDVKAPVRGTCTRCGYVSSNPVCHACLLLDGLNKGMPRVALGKGQGARAELRQVQAAAAARSAPDF